MKLLKRRQTLKEKAAYYEQQMEAARRERDVLEEIIQIQRQELKEWKNRVRVEQVSL